MNLAHYEEALFKGISLDSMEDNLWLRARRAFLPFYGVVGVGYGAQLTRGKLVTRDAIIVLVERKLPVNKLRDGERIPPTFEGVPTDVRMPVLMPRSKGPQDLCLTDYQWLDWQKLDRMWREQHNVRKAPR